MTAYEAQQMASQPIVSVRAGQLEKRPVWRSSAWLLSFTDLLMLLLTFFVFLLSVSDINGSRYKNFADQMGSAYGIEGKQDIDTLPQVDLDPDDSSIPPSDEGIQNTLHYEIEHNLIKVEESSAHIVIRFQEHVAFASASATLDNAFIPTLDKISELLADSPGTITIIGHTDDRPIATFRFRSNWELASARAVSVAHALLKNPILDARRIVITSYGDSKPLVINDSEENRALNRRVEIQIEKMTKFDSNQILREETLITPAGGVSRADP